MSTITPVISSEPGLAATHVPAFEPGFTPWDISYLFDSSMNLIPGFNHDHLRAGSINRTGSDVALSRDTDERRNKRKLSNRESARRSREKKQKHLEEMSIQLNQLKIENQGLTNRLRFVLSNCQRTKSENDRLRLELCILQERLLNVGQLLIFRHQIERSSTSATWPCNNSTIYDPTGFIDSNKSCFSFG